MEDKIRGGEGIPRSCNKRGDIGNAAFNLLGIRRERGIRRFPPRVCFEPRGLETVSVQPSVMAARGGREDGGFQTRIVELGMPVNERKKGAHGLFEARVYSPLCTRPVLSFVYLSRLLFILTTACLWPRSSITRESYLTFSTFSQTSDTRQYLCISRGKPSLKHGNNKTLLSEYSIVLFIFSTFLFISI